MFLNKLSVINFKNLGEAALSFDCRINCLVGDNGAGKTNLLDGVHYLSMCKSSLTMTDSQCTGHGTEFFVLDGQYTSDRALTETVVCSFRKGGGKTVKRNGKEYERISDHLGVAPVVIVSPADTQLISDSADERRRFLNVFLSPLDRTYLSAIMRYNRILAERNRLLKNHDGHPAGDLLEVLDMQLAESGTVVYESRRSIVEQLAPETSRFYTALSGDREQVELAYRSEMSAMSLSDLLLKNREKDSICRFTTAGPHRDDVKMTIGGHTLRKYGSQGQQKSFLIALKLAQYVITARRLGEKPILLLDDLFDKLDTGRVERLLELVSGPEFGQIFITDCNRSRVEKILSGGTEKFSVFEVSEGCINKLTTPTA